MEDKRLNVRLHHSGAFGKTAYSAGTSLLINRVHTDEFSYTVLMEYVKDYLHFTEIGGVYIKKKQDNSWKLVTCDKEVIELVNGCKDGDEIDFYVDNTVDTEIEPMVQMQPHVVVRPRKNLIQGSAKKPVPPKKTEKRKYVTTHELQQKQKQMKLSKKSPDMGRRRSLRLSPNLLTSQPDASAMNVKGIVRRKLDLHIDSSGEECSEENDSITELAPPPPPRLTKYEEKRIAQMQQNDKKLEEFGIKKLVVQLNGTATQKGKGKEKNNQEECDDYIPENEDETQSDDTSERIKNAKKRKLLSGPQTRSRANATQTSSPANATQTSSRANAIADMKADKEVASSSRANLLQPTCSKLLKQSNQAEACGSLSAYLALRDRQKQGMLTPPTKNVHEPNLEKSAEEETEAVVAPRRWRGRTKMTAVHARGRNDRPVVLLNKRGQPVSKNRKLLRELSNFLGTVAKDNVSLAYVNWRVVPGQLKKKMWEYTRDRYIIPDNGQRWVDKTISTSWRTYKSRVKERYYKKYETDEDRMANRPNTIPLEDFKLLVKYWADEAVQKLAEKNEARRASVTDTHTLGPNSMAQVREKLKTGNPNLGSPSDGHVYLQSHKREEGRTYKTNTAEIRKRIDQVKEKVAAGEDASELIANGKSHGREWLKGRHGKSSGSGSTLAPVDPFIEDVTEKIKRDLEVELDAKVNMKVQEKLSMLLKKLAEENPGLNLDVADFCATASSEDGENATPRTVGAST